MCNLAESNILDNKWHKFYPTKDPQTNFHPISQKQLAKPEPTNVTKTKTKTQKLTSSNNLNEHIQHSQLSSTTIQSTFMFHVLSFFLLSIAVGAGCVHVLHHTATDFDNNELLVSTNSLYNEQMNFEIYNLTNVPDFSMLDLPMYGWFAAEEILMWIQMNITMLLYITSTIIAGIVAFVYYCLCYRPLAYTCQLSQKVTKQINNHIDPSAAIHMCKLFQRLCLFIFLCLCESFVGMVRC
jgi:hypothetical protein